MTRRPAAAITAVVALAALLACKKGEGGASEKPLLDKPLEQITQDDLKAAIAPLGLSVSSCTNSKSGNYSNFMCTGSKEHEKGTTSPDGKKRMFVTLAVFTYPAERKDAELSRLSARGPVEAAGDRILSVEVKPDGAGDAKDYMKRLRGR